MGAKGRKKSQKAKVKTVEKKIAVQQYEEDEDDNFDLETMEKMLGNDDNSEEESGDDDSAAQDFMDDDGEEEEEGEGEDDDDQEENYDEPEEKVEELDSDDDEKQYEDEDDEEDTDTEETDIALPNDSSDNIIEGDENCTLDLRNLLSINSHQVNHRLLYQQKAKDQSKDGDDVATICTTGMMKANEDYLLQKASEGCSQLLAGLWSLEKEKSEAGPMAVLPTYCQIVTPRELVSYTIIAYFLLSQIIE